MIQAADSTVALSYVTLQIPRTGCFSPPPRHYNRSCYSALCLLYCDGLKTECVYLFWRLSVIGGIDRCRAERRGQRRQEGGMYWKALSGGARPLWREVECHRRGERGSRQGCCLQIHMHGQAHKYIHSSEHAHEHMAFPASSGTLVRQIIPIFLLSEISVSIPLSAVFFFFLLPPLFLFCRVFISYFWIDWTVGSKQGKCSVMVLNSTTIQTIQRPEWSRVHVRTAYTGWSYGVLMSVSCCY